MATLRRVTQTEIKEAERAYATTKTTSTCPERDYAVDRAHERVRKLNWAFTLQIHLTNVRKAMRDAGVRRTSCFNGGLTAEEYRFNAELFRLKTELEQTFKELGR